MRKIFSAAVCVGLLGITSAVWATEYDPTQRPYTIRPAWSFQLDSTHGTLEQNDSSADPRSEKIPSGVGIHFNYQPTFLQALGTFSVGPSFYFYPFSTINQRVLKTPHSWAAGAEARYQLRLFRKQWLVPTAAYHSQYLAYQLSDGTSGKTMVRGHSLGALFLLNAIDREISLDFFKSWGALRTYLLAELRMTHGNDRQIIFSQKSYFFGLRIEY